MVEISEQIYGNTNNTSVLRLSEMYLIRAEAIHKGASISGVTPVDDYNVIRTIIIVRII